MGTENRHTKPKIEVSKTQSVTKENYGEMAESPGSDEPKRKRFLAPPSYCDSNSSQGPHNIMQDTSSTFRPATAYTRVAPHALRHALRIQCCIPCAFLDCAAHARKVSL